MWAFLNQIMKMLYYLVKGHMLNKNAVGILNVIIVTSCNCKRYREWLKQMFALPVGRDKKQLKGRLPSVVKMLPLYPGSLC